MSRPVPVLPMFPLGSVLFPAMPLSLRVFEPRYLALLERVLDADGEFGTVLIERGSDVGGGDHRFSAGTVARIVSVRAEDGWIGVTAVGGQRVEVVQWLPDDPYPLAEVRPLPSLVWSPEWDAVFSEADRAVRRALSRATEFGIQLWPPDVSLDDDPGVASWQLAGIAPLGELDRISLLTATSLEDLLGRLAQLADATAESPDLSGIQGLWIEGDGP